MVLPSNARLAVLEHVFVFNLMHLVYDIMRDHGLQFPRESVQHAHLDDWHKANLFKIANMVRD